MSALKRVLLSLQLAALLDLIQPSHSFLHGPIRQLARSQGKRIYPPSMLSSISYMRSHSFTRTSLLHAGKDNNINEEEWEYEEYEELEESDFYNSEWKVGTVWESNRQKIDVTWCRLVAKEKELKAVWGDGAMGKWSFDRGSQFISVSKETWGGWGGKKIWAGVIDDFYFMEGTVRGWSPLSPASVLGQWQAKRLGVDPDEMGTAPWFQEDTTEENQISSEDKDDRGSDKLVPEASSSTETEDEKNSATTMSEELLKNFTKEKEVQIQDNLNSTIRSDAAPSFVASE
jgi:hypothetical protein